MTNLKPLPPWTPAQKTRWFEEQTVKRSYLEEVRLKLDELSLQFKLTKYGALSLDPGRYALFLIQTLVPIETKPTVLITGGVHGYETSGVQGAIAFMKNHARKYEKHFNFICAPCISPWAYETINRWNPKAIDPNRSFKAESPAEECALLLTALAPHLPSLLVHIDLHETTDTDNSIFRPALAARDGKVQTDFSEIPDGFYTVGDSENPCADFQKAIIQSVKKVTHIAPPDADGKIIGDPMEQEGVINYAVKKMFLCAGLSNAKYTTTTEVYPDSPKATPEICIEAQVAAITGGLDYVISQG